MPSKPASSPRSSAPRSRRPAAGCRSTPARAARSLRPRSSPRLPRRPAPTVCFSCRPTWSRCPSGDWSTTPARSRSATDLPLIVYNRGNARYTEASAVEVAQLPTVVGFKDGTGDVDMVARIVRAVTDALEPAGKPFQFFNGLPTAEVSQQAYRAIGVTLYSSATFAFAPELALAFYDGLERDDDELVAALLREFFHPLVRLRDTVPGYAVSLIKAGVTMEGLEAGPVRPPLIMPSAEDLDTLAQIIAAGRAVIADELAVAR